MPPRPTLKEQRRLTYPLTRSQLQVRVYTDVDSDVCKCRCRMSTRFPANVDWNVENISNYQRAKSPKNTESYMQNLSWNLYIYTHTHTNTHKKAHFSSIFTTKVRNVRDWLQKKSMSIEKTCQCWIYVDVNVSSKCRPDMVDICRHPYETQIYLSSHKCHINTPFFRVRCQVNKTRKSRTNTFYDALWRCHYAPKKYLHAVQTFSGSARLPPWSDCSKPDSFLKRNERAYSIGQSWKYFIEFISAEANQIGN